MSILRPVHTPIRARPPRPALATPALAALAVAALAAAAALAAQAAADRPGSGVISGAVVDARTGAPLPGATVVLSPETSGAFPGAASGSAFASATRTALTDSAGLYRFADLPAGAYRLSVTRLSYRPYSVVVEFGAGRSSDLSVGLVADPIALEPVTAWTAAAQPYPASPRPSADAAASAARVRAREEAGRRYLTTDARELTGADVAEAVTLGDADVLRALQRLPGVSTRSDYTAELWTRGAPWSHTSVYWDGVPLPNPLHALGMISGVGSAALGAVWFHPGTRPASLAEGAAGVVELRSRRATGEGALNVRADASLGGGGVALDQRILEGRAGWMLSGRVSYLDWWADLARRAGPDSDRAFPYGFGELSGNLDARVGARSAVEASWLCERDRLRSAHPEEPLRSRWGNALGRVTARSALGSLAMEHTLAASEHEGIVRSEVRTASGPTLALEPVSETRVGIHELGGSFWPEGGGAASPRWRVGYGLRAHSVDYSGPAPLAIPRASVTDQVLQSGEPSVLPAREWHSTLGVLALWGERTWGDPDRLSARAGLRAETGSEVAASGPVRLAPRLALRYAPIPDAALSLGAARVYQYAQALAPGGVQLASLVSTDAWLLAGSDLPALVADIGTAGVEVWLAPGRVATLNGYGRRTAGVITPDPTPGPIAGRAEFRRGTGSAYGVELSVRQLSGPVTASVSYALSRSWTSAAGLRYHSAADRPHVLDATVMTRVAPSVRLGAALTVASGVPFTPVAADTAACAVLPGCAPDSLPWLGAAHSQRAPAFASLDLLVDWSALLGDWDVGVFGQLRNALDRTNATVYAGDGSGCPFVGCEGEDVRSLDERGLPRLPVVGVRVRR